MELSQGSSSSNSASRRNWGYKVTTVPCHCNIPSILLKAWTDDNPGRRFYKCGGKMKGCDFFQWADEEKPHGWQKFSLLEARDQIRQQKGEIKNLQDELMKIKAGNDHVGDIQVESVMEMTEMMKKFEEEKRSLELESMASKEREKLLRQFVVLSWGGFIVVTALMVNMVKRF